MPVSAGSQNSRRSHYDQARDRRLEATKARVRRVSADLLGRLGWPGPGETANRPYVPSVYSSEGQAILRRLLHERFTLEELQARIPYSVMARGGSALVEAALAAVPAVPWER